MKITLVTDNPKSWIMPYVSELKRRLGQKHRVIWVYDVKKIKPGECAFFLACEKIVSKEILGLHKHNLVVHESALPQGRGWSPLTWQILEGKNEIPITLFEARENVDSGDIYLQTKMKFEGHELVDELRRKQGEATMALVLEFGSRYPKIKGQRQSGKASFYGRRRPSDSELDVNRPLKEQFNLLRVVDNERYPAFFIYRGRKYFLKIYGSDETIEDLSKLEGVKKNSNISSAFVRPAATADARPVWEIRNDPKNRVFMLHSEFIPLTSHMHWFKVALKKRENLFLVLELREKLIGYLRFERKEKHLRTISIALDSRFHGKGLGSHFLQIALQRYKNFLQNDILLAEIKKGNKASQKLFKKFGFRLVKSNQQMYIYRYRFPQ